MPKKPVWDESGTGRDESGESRDESAEGWDESAARAGRQRSGGGSCRRMNPWVSRRVPLSARASGGVWLSRSRCGWTFSAGGSPTAAAAS